MAGSQESGNSVWRYRFDTFMAKGGVSTFIALTVVFLAIFILICVARLIFLAVIPGDASQWAAEGPWGHIFVTFLQLTDPGNMAQDIESSIFYQVFAVFAGLAGVIMLSALIAFITTALDQKIEELKRGHSKVIEENHTLILGWDDQRVIEILRELIIANESEDDACVVILAEKDKQEMDDHLRLQLPDTMTTRVVTRSGSTSSLVNLDIVSVEESKSCIILASCDETAAQSIKVASDAKTIQMVLALTSMRRSGDGEVPEDDDWCIVAEIYNQTYRDILEGTFKSVMVTIDTSDILAKILVQTSRSVGLSVVYSEILSFDGCEMYFHHDTWGDIAWGDFLYRFPDGVPMGVRHGDGSLTMRPALEYKLQEDDDILIVADDDSTIDFRDKPVAQPKEYELAGGRLEPEIEKELIIGWNHKTPTILEQYADYVKEGSQIDIMLNNPSDEIRARIEEIDFELPDVNISLVVKDCLNRDDLLSMKPFEYDNIIILADAAGDVEDQQVDSENIVTLLLLREIFKDHPTESANTKLITEVLDSQNYLLVSKAGVKDVIISNRLISMLLAQVSEGADIKRVYDDIFEEDGSEIYLKPAWLYFKEFPVTVSFADIMLIAQKREEVCFGVKTIADETDPNKNFGVELIPLKDKQFTINRDDSFVVLAEDEL